MVREDGRRLERQPPAEDRTRVHSELRIYQWSKLATAFASGEGPDIFIISPGDFLRYYNGGVLEDLTPFIDDKAKADFPESVIANRMVDGKIFGIPMEVEPMAMYYSVKAFEEAGLNENDVPKTWEALLEVAKKLTTSSASE